MERAMALGALLRGSSIHLNTPNIQKGTYILAIRRCTHSHLPGLFLLCETKVFLASCSLPQSRSTPPNPSPRSPRPRCQATPNLFPHSSCPTGPWELLQLRGSEGRTGEGAARVSYLEGGEVGVAHDPLDGLEVGQVPLRHVHQLGGVYLVGEVGRAVLQRGRVFILVAVFLGWGPRQSLDQPSASGFGHPPGPPPFPPAVQCGRPWGLTSSSPSLSSSPLAPLSPPSRQPPLQPRPQHLSSLP